MEYIEGGSFDGTSRFCFGCEQLGGVDWGNVDADEVSEAVRLALDCGVNFFDTAAAYGLGKSEQRLSAALDGRKRNVVVATKGGLTAHFPSGASRATVVRDSSRKAIRSGILSSLENLQVDSIPVFLLHWPDAATPIEETIEEVLSFKRRGLIQRFGLSNFSLEEMLEVQKSIDVDVVQLSFNLLDDTSQPVIEACARQGIPVCAYGVLAQGLLTGKYTRGSTFDTDDRRHRLPHFEAAQMKRNVEIAAELNHMAERLGKSAAQIAIRYVLQHAGISSVIVGIKSCAQLRDCIDVFEWRLEPSEVAFLESLTNSR